MNYWLVSYFCVNAQHLSFIWSRENNLFAELICSLQLFSWINNYCLRLIIFFIAAAPDSPDCCAFILTFLSYLLIMVTLPVSLCMCIKVINQVVFKKKMFVYVLIYLFKNEHFSLDGHLVNKQDQKSNRYDSIFNGYRWKNGLMITHSLTDFHTPNLEMLSHVKRDRTSDMQTFDQLWNKFTFVWDLC